MTIETARAAGKKIFALIDGKSIYYRGYYAMPQLTTSDGQPTGGVYGFAALALELIRRINPDYVAVAWDKPKTNIRRRKQIYDGYKAGRHAAPPDFYAQIPTLHELLRALGWPLYEADDYEADDIMGTLSQAANKIGIHTVLISSDMDMLQLVDDDTEMYALKKGLSNLEKFDPCSFEDKYGIKVTQFLDLKSLKGDGSDNIPGVPGVGEKTAISLLQKYQTLDGIYDHIAEIGGAVHDKLVAGKDSAYMSRELAKIWCDAPIPLDLDAIDVTKLDRAKLHQVLLELQFTSLLKRLPENMKLAESMVPAEPSSQVECVSQVLQKNLELQPVPDKLANPVVAIVYDDKLYLSDNPEAYYQVPFTRAAELLADHQVVAYDLKVLSKQFLVRNLPVNFRLTYDTKHASFLLNSLKPVSSLDDYSLEQGATFDAMNRLMTTYSMWKDTEVQLTQNQRLYRLAVDVDFPLQLVLARMEARGVAVDADVLKQMSGQLGDEIKLLEQAIWREVGYEFNIASPKQLSEALFDKLQLPTTSKRGKSGSYPTGAKELAKLAGKHPVINLISDYRELSKLKSTYVDALPKAVATDGRIHTTFSQDITATGRLSSSNPNLQNIPTRTERGREIKRAFVASTGKVIINADYAQFELRLAAALADDTKMIQMFTDPANDIHTMTAAEAYGIAPSEVTPAQRRHAKVINFGVLYGMSPHGLAEATDMDFSTAKAFIDRYFAIRKPIRDFLDQTLKQADDVGYVETLFGRRRPTPDVKSANFMVREAAKRAAANMPIQGTEADLMKMAMLKVEQIADASQVMQIHDSIMVECDPTEADRIAAEMKDIMENIYPDLGVRLVVETKIGTTWADL
ncbi:MAG: DNA polymerase I [Candidatus Saccharibacteria bacterium]|nr:DNA polymerase I [Candidatus Saccharibacteria bacterium]